MIKVGTFRVQKGLCLELQDFLFETRFSVSSFNMMIVPKGDDGISFPPIKGGAFPKKIQDFLRKDKRLKPGTTITFDKIKGKDPCGRVLSLGSASYVLN